MIKWILFGLLGYMVYKAAGPVFTLFKMNQDMHIKKRKTDLHKKVQKMDIQDAEFEEKPE